MASKANAGGKAPRVKIEAAQQIPASPSQQKADAPATPSAPQASVSPAKRAAASAPKQKVAVVVPSQEPVPSKTEGHHRAASAHKPKAAPAARSAVAPKVTEPDRTTFEDASREEPTAQASQGQPEQQPAQEARPSKTFGDLWRSMAGWVHRTFAGHEHAFWGGVLAFVLALLTFVVGPLRMLVLCVVVVVGVAIGQVLDGDPKIIRAIQGLFGGDRDQE